MKDDMKKFHQVQNVNIEKGVLCLIVDGNSIQKDFNELLSILTKCKGGRTKVV